MFGRIAAGVALTATLGIGTAGVAVAATQTSSAPTTAPVHHFTCAQAPRALARIARVDARIQKWLPKAQTREQAAKQAGKTTLAKHIERRISRVEHLETRLEKIKGKITTLCPGAGAAPAATSPTAKATT
jgi:hypothetical protein